MGMQAFAMGGKEVNFRADGERDLCCCYGMTNKQVAPKTFQNRMKMMY